MNKNLIISRTPLRVSFFGGGTDLEYYSKFNEGKVISTAIDKYVYVVVRDTALYTKLILDLIIQLAKIKIHYQKSKIR